jgi:hypothetical protein
LVALFNSITVDPSEITSEAERDYLFGDEAAYLRAATAAKA